jgi:hypothetical protein
VRMPDAPLGRLGAGRPERKPPAHEQRRDDKPVEREARALRRPPVAPSPRGSRRAQARPPSPSALRLSGGCPARRSASRPRRPSLLLPVG